MKTEQKGDTMKKTCDYCVFVGKDPTKCWLQSGNEPTSITAREGIACHEYELDESLHEVILIKGEERYMVCLNCREYDAKSKGHWIVCSVMAIATRDYETCGAWKERHDGDLAELRTKIAGEKGIER